LDVRQAARFRLVAVEHEAAEVVGCVRADAARLCEEFEGGGVIGLQAHRTPGPPTRGPPRPPRAR
jgi:hypothetical protein